MFFETLSSMADYALFLSCLLLLAGSILLTLKTRFVQVRHLPLLFKMFWTSLTQRKHAEGKHTILPHKALFTAMSTTLGIGTIVAPVIAIHLGGPGALVGFLLTSFFGSAATYIEVNLCIQHRKKTESGEIMGGPMQYLKNILSPAAAKWYAISCFILMIVWSGAQSNQLAAVLSSPLLGEYSVSKAVSGCVIAFFLMLFLMGGIKRIGSFSSKLVPVMFVLYVGSSLWILSSNTEKILPVLGVIFQSAFTPYAMATGTLVEASSVLCAGASLKESRSTRPALEPKRFPIPWRRLKIRSHRGLLRCYPLIQPESLLSCQALVSLITGTWEIRNSVGHQHGCRFIPDVFFYFGVAIVGISALLFGFGTILGNSYNGSQCFNYLTDNTKIRYYYMGTALMVFVGALTEVRTIWSLSDIVLAAMAILHMTGLLTAVFRKPVIEPIVEEQRLLET